MAESVGEMASEVSEVPGVAPEVLKVAPVVPGVLAAVPLGSTAPGDPTLRTPSGRNIIHLKPLPSTTLADDLSDSGGESDGEGGSGHGG